MTAPAAVVVGVGVGAERGLGAALCRRFAAEGHHVLVAGRTPDKIGQVVRMIVAAGGSAEPVAMDATREEDVARLFDRAMAPGEGFEPADIVVSNAGNNQRIDFRALTARQFEDFWRVGCLGGFLVGREAARRLVPRVAAPSSSPALPQASAESRASRISLRRKPGSGWSPRAWRGNTARKVSTSLTSSSMAGSTASGCIDAPRS